MESSEGTSTAAATTAAATAVDLDAPPSSPPLLDSGSSPPLGSPEEAVHRDLSPPFDEDHGDDDQDHGENHDDKDHGDQSSETGVLADDLKLKIIKQVEYYFSDGNLPTDKHLLNLIKKNKEGFVPISVIASFRKMKKLTRDQAFIVTALKESSLLVVSSDGKKLKRLNPLPEARDPKLFTILVENLPKDHSVENIRKIFGEAGNIKNISIRDPHATDESEKGGKKEKLISTKLHALVEYETVEAAEKAAATLNNEQDWRNGLRVKLLNQVGKYGQRRQAWREPESEKSSVGRVHDQTGVEDHGHGHGQHVHDTPDEEDVGHHHKDKNGNKGRNRGRPRRQNYHHANNGLGHGTTSSSSSHHHHIEVSKPPPGPRMPDGTRGFMMGRGRPPPPTSSEN